MRKNETIYLEGSDIIEEYLENMLDKYIAYIENQSQILEEGGLVLTIEGVEHPINAFLVGSEVDKDLIVKLNEMNIDVYDRVCFEDFALLMRLRDFLKKKIYKDQSKLEISDEEAGTTIIIN